MPGSILHINDISEHNVHVGWWCSTAQYLQLSTKDWDFSYLHSQNWLVRNLQHIWTSVPYLHPPHFHSCDECSQPFTLFCNFSTSMYYCTCRWKVKIGEVLEWDLDSYNVDMSKSIVCKHLGVDLLTHTTSVQELSIICKVWFWISYTAHIPKIGTSISVWYKRSKDHAAQ